MDHAPLSRDASDVASTLPVPRHDWALFLDLDGTLIDIAPTPDSVVVEPGVVASLIAARSALSGALAIVSGREVAVIDALLAPARLPAAGCHGAEFRADPALPAMPLGPSPPAHVVARAQYEADATGLLLERKPTSMVLHFRQAPEREAQALRIARGLAAELGPGFELLPSHMAFELRPAGIDKGQAVTRLMRSPPFRGRIPFFLGDDVTDEAGIAAARSLGGDGVRLGSQVDATPSDVRAWLARLPAAVSGYAT